MGCGGRDKDEWLQVEKDWEAAQLYVETRPPITRVGKKRFGWVEKGISLDG